MKQNSRTNMFKKLRKLFSVNSLTVRLPIIPLLLNYETTIKLSDFIDGQRADEQIQQLDQIREQLRSIISVIDDLETEAKAFQKDVTVLEEEIKILRVDKDTAETVLKVPEESLTRLIARANSKGKWWGRFEGLLIGFVASLLVWLLSTLYT